jgi:alpha-ketoglutarate-dependent taurine dioxygenase
LKVSEIPGLGSFGHYVDDVDFDNLSKEEWFEIGKLHLDGLVTILRNVNITRDQYVARIREFGPNKGTRNSRAHFKIKYGEDFDPKDELTFAPEVALLGYKNMVGSTTGFVQSVDLYESFSESFRSELDEMVVIHEYIPGGINDREITDLNLGNVLRMEFCQFDGSEVPMVLTSPGGHKGLHYTTNTATGIKGMSI